ncbi:MAG: cell division protein SepF [Clostridiales Family XIII bacterium]|jgi:cell division inhibitor SepF|nr:cell division protein SepF [Clostridiales Family XIII bacterium]
MGLISSFKDLFLDEEYEEISDNEVLSEPERASKPERTERQARTVLQPRERPQENYESKREKVIAMPGAASSTLDALTRGYKIVVIEPKSFEECPKLVDSIKGRKPVIINLEAVPTDTARKIFDFLSGGTYALNGKVQKIAQNIFVFLPENIDVSGESDQAIRFGEDAANPWKL